MPKFLSTVKVINIKVKVVILWIWKGHFWIRKGYFCIVCQNVGGHGVLVAKKALENSRLTGTEFIGLSSTRVLINRFLIKNVYLVVNFGSQRRTNIKPALRGPPGGLARSCPYQIISAKVTYILNRHCDIISVLHLQAKFLISLPLL